MSRVHICDGCGETIESGADTVNVAVTVIAKHYKFVARDFHLDCLPAGWQVMRSEVLK